VSSPNATWVPVPADSDFPVDNLPFGVFHTKDRPEARVGVAIGDHVLDLTAVRLAGLLPADLEVAGSLAGVLATRARGSEVRARVAQLLSAGNDELHVLADRGLVRRVDAVMHLPFVVGDYVDFYSSIEHASNVGALFRPGDEPLPPNWRHLPIGYHGRVSTLLPSGSPVVRPAGQRKPPQGPPVFGPTRALDFELEVGFFAGEGTEAGRQIPVDTAEAHVAGLVLVNDWSARDIQAWEYQPLGPFLGKSFATTVSPWVVTLEALEPYRVDAPPQAPPPLPYLTLQPRRGLDLQLEVELNGTVIARTNLRHMYWTIAQQLAHLASNGTRVCTGDLFATGTVSGPSPDAVGCLLERTHNGAEPITLDDGTTRAYLEDGDTVVLRGWCGGGDRPRIGLGECRGTVLAAPDLPSR
jgi:fumarylacetoacetase